MVRSLEPAVAGPYDLNFSYFKQDYDAFLASPALPSLLLWAKKGVDGILRFGLGL
jgi:hypothetical protein